MKRRPILMVVGAVLMASIFLMVGVPLVLQVIWHYPAAPFLKDFTAVRAGTTTFEDAQRLTHKYRAKHQNLRGEEQPCSPRECEWEFVFSNGQLDMLPGARTVALGGIIDVKDGRVVNSMLVYTARSGASSGTKPMVPIPQAGGANSVSFSGYGYGVIDTTEPEEKDFRVMKQDADSAGVPHQLTVILGPRTSADVRKRAYSIDLSCLGKWHGCDGPSAVYPAGWENLQ